MSYIEMFIAPVPVGSQEAYLALSRKMAEIHRENGAREIMECWGNDVPDLDLRHRWDVAMSEIKRRQC